MKKVILLSLFLLVFLSGCAPKVVVLREKMGAPPALVTDEIALAAKPAPPVRKRLIVIDPGHGGSDFGTQAPFKPAFKEKNLNLITARFLQTYLQQMGYQTAMTRTSDLFVTLDGRAQFANEKNSDLFVSVHFNSAPSTNADGVEVFYYRSEQNKERSSTSKALAEAILKRVISNTDAKSRGVKHGNLAVIRKTTMPAVLVEGGFLTNEKELQKIKDPAYIKRLAWGIAQGVQEFLNQRPYALASGE